MPRKIFISYRRDDAAGQARGIYDRLAARFGARSVFMDVDNLLPGERFDEKLAQALDDCDVLIAVIGSSWMDLLKAPRRQRDWVRLEIAEALGRRIVVIPVRVGRVGQMPALPEPEDLPDDIRNLVLHQAHDVTHERFGRDIQDLAQAIARLRPQGPRVPWRWVAAVLVAVVAVTLYVVTSHRPPIEEGGKGPPSHTAVVPPASDASPKDAISPPSPTPQPKPDATGIKVDQPEADAAPTPSASPPQADLGLVQGAPAKPKTALPYGDSGSTTGIPAPDYRRLAGDLRAGRPVDKQTLADARGAIGALGKSPSTQADSLTRLVLVFRC